MDNQPSNNSRLSSDEDLQRATELDVNSIKDEDVLSRDIDSSCTVQDVDVVSTVGQIFPADTQETAADTSTLSVDADIDANSADVVSDDSDTETLARQLRSTS